MKKELTNIIYDIPLWALDIQMPRHLRRHLDAFWGMSFFHVCSTSKFMSPNFCSAMFFGVFWSTGFTLCWFRRPVPHVNYRARGRCIEYSFWRPFASRLCWFCKAQKGPSVYGVHRCIKRKTFSTKTCFRRDMYRPLA